MSSTQEFTNRLIHETSPYLLQHAHNPVDWYAWGPEALERARREQRPIFLSIGYSACHWCHVMEHESFENAEIAAVMNEHFVNIKVDREERPDLDHIYMAAVQMMTQHGGWPMSVFLTPDLEPFYGGTYFPPEDRDYGQQVMPGFRRILLGVSEAWQNRRGEVARSAGQLAAALAQMNELAASGPAVSLDLIDQAVARLARGFDAEHGGFGRAPKFPHPMDLKLCLRHWKRTGRSESLEMVVSTLDRMARGGIYDQLGGGFHRYSTDARWLVPHFEKMLYDNALLAQTYLEAHQATANGEFSRVARETLDYVLREMTSPEGGFFSTQDADSEGVEGKFFVWSLAEVQSLLGPATDSFSYVFDVTADGNWDGHNILNSLKTMDQCARLLRIDRAALEQSLAASRATLLAARSRRVPPGRDDKVLVSWNGLMIDAMARGFQVLGDERYLAAARRAAEFILEKMWRVPGDAQKSDADQPRAGTTRHSPLTTHLLHSYKDGRARFNAYLDDYGCLIDGLVSLYESDFQAKWLAAALELADVMVEQFWDAAGGGFYFTGKDHEQLIARVRDAHDGATPSGNSMAVAALLRLGKLTGRGDLLEKAERTMQSLAGLLDQQSVQMGQMLIAVDFWLDAPIEIALVGGPSPHAEREFAAALEIIRGRFLPNKVVAALGGGPTPAAAAAAESVAPVPLLANRPAVNEQVTAYVCENFTCELPAIGLDALKRALEARCRAPAGS